MTIEVFQHVPFEGPAFIENIAEKNHWDLQICRLDEGEQPLSPTDYDMLIIMGGPMNIYEESNYPWLNHEKKAIEQAIKSDKLIFGICLGAQLIADVLGSRVYKNKEKEIGWFPVSRSHPGSGNPPLHFMPDIATVFHWHGETFDIPKNAIPLFQSDATPNQAFLFEKNVLALQFHLEMTQTSLEDILHFCKADLGRGKYIMSDSEILENYKLYESSNKKMLSGIFRYFSHFLDP